jgi:hypothetical protein
MKTKNIFLIVILLLSISVVGFSQAKKPDIMVVPSDNWCLNNGYMQEFDNQGTKERIPDYGKAFQENSDLILVTAKFGELMAQRGFTLVKLEETLKSLKSQAAEDAMLSSKSGAGIVESPIDKLKKVAKCDIIMKITWTINQRGPQKSITFVLEGIDAYTNEQIAGASGTGAPSFSAELPVLLEESVLSHLDNFNTSLQKHFDDLFANGRIISVRIKTFSSFNGDLESEFGGKELGSIIEDWISENTVKGRFNTADATESMMLFKGVRIPMYDTNNKAINARDWAKGLQSMLKEKFSITSKLMTQGLGQAQLVIGEK